jgi:hypothetical protein
VNPLVIAFSVVLGCSAVLAAMLVSHARASARDYLRFAAVLYLALALCNGLAAADPGPTTLGLLVAVTHVVRALAPVTLAFALLAAFEHPPSAWIATISMVSACSAGIADAALGNPMLSLASLTVGVLAILALCIRRWRVEKRSASHAFLSGCCLICAAAASLAAGAGARIAPILFPAAAILGFSLALARRSDVAVANARDLRMGAAVSEKR